MKEHFMLRVFTTGQVAQVFNVNINTVIKWFDEGKLEGFRLPHSRERRIYRESLTDFMVRHDIAPDLLSRFEAARQRDKGKGVEQRCFPRKAVARLRGRLEAMGVSFAVELHDLSVGGVSLEAQSAPSQLIPEVFELSVSDAGGARLLKTRCELMHLRREANQRLRLGCRFLSVDPDHLRRCLPMD